MVGKGLCLEGMVGLTVWRTHEMQPGHEMLKANRKAVQWLQNPAVIQYIPILSLGFVSKYIV